MYPRYPSPLRVALVIVVVRVVVGEHVLGKLRGIELAAAKDARRRRVHHRRRATVEAIW